MKRAILPALAALFLLSGCLAPPEAIQDVRVLPQDHASYFTGSTQSEAPLSTESQARMDEDYNIIYFSVWHQKHPLHARKDRVVSDFQHFAQKPGYGENKRKHPPSWIRNLQRNAYLDGYPNVLDRGVTVRNTNLRALPTQKPHFHATDGDSDAWPFDNLQRSSVPGNTPIFICHFSRDKSWALVETSFAYGWIPTEDFAFVNDDVARKWEIGRYAVILRDQISVLDEKNRFLARASLGHIFPLLEATEERMEVLVATAGKNGQALLQTGFVSAEAAAEKPLRFNRVNAARIANELIGEPYGWGGLYGNRDCSAMTRDFFTVFGIWLPRHSADQVKETGFLVDLQGLSAMEKEKTIIAKGIPYLSLLWRKGHVMLYIGQKDGRALIFHNAWGVRTKDLQGREGRKIIGQAVITTLEPGKELRNVDTDAGSLLDHIAAMNILDTTGFGKEFK
jgi:hypothetical protein